MQNLQETKINLFGQDLSLKEAFDKVKSYASKIPLLNETGKKLILEHYFEEFELIPGKNGFPTRDEFLETFCKNENLSNTSDFDNYLKRIGQSKEIFIDALIYKEQIEKLKKTIITSQEISDNFIQYKSQNDKALFGLLKTEKEQLARELYYKLTHDRLDFMDLVKNYSKSPDRNNDCLIGPVCLHLVNPELRERIEKMENGEISKPFSMNGREFVILKLYRVIRVEITPQIETIIRNELYDKWLSRQLGLIAVKVTG